MYFSGAGAPSSLVLSSPELFGDAYGSLCRRREEVVVESPSAGDSSLSEPNACSHFPSPSASPSSTSSLLAFFNSDGIGWRSGEETDPRSTGGPRVRLAGAKGRYSFSRSACLFPTSSSSSSSSPPLPVVCPAPSCPPPPRWVIAPRSLCPQRGSEFWLPRSIPAPSVLAPPPLATPLPPPPIGEVARQLKLLSRTGAALPSSSLTPLLRSVVVCVSMQVYPDLRSRVWVTHPSQSGRRGPAGSWTPATVVSRGSYALCGPIA
ncbi:hypothetical protein JZ751_005733 [Albula glossodonta]|uniref:Uncharacterized protein n=1 Tax=Albula glossodonta TaxID=121402 RepID=A0A8T2NBB5_9TELE|nr:hypothetical protein JZ751_005733 [Albula glossodonta]